MKRKAIILVILVIIFLVIAGTAAVENEQPVAKGSVAPQECFACERDNIILDASGSYDKDGQVVKYEWYYNNNLIATGKRVSLGKEFTENPGTYKIILKVTDNGGATDDYELQVLVKSNPTPEIKELKYTDEDFFVFGDKISVTAVLEKKNYGKLNYDWDYDLKVFKKIGDGNKVVFEVISSKAIWKDYKISVVVSNACGKKDSEEIGIEVRPSRPNSLLKTEIILPLKIEEGRSFQVRSSFVIEEGVDVSYLWKVFRVLNEGDILIKSSSRESPSFTLSDSGVYNITLEITDRYGARGNDSVDFWVKEMINDPPIADASATQKTAVFGEVFTLNASKSRDPDGTPWKTIDRYCWYDKTYREELGCSKQSVLNVVFNRSGPHDIILTVKDTGKDAGRDNGFPKPLSDTDFITINVVKSSDVSAPTPIPTQSAPQPTYRYQERSQSRLTSETSGMGFGSAIVMLIIAIVLRKRKIKT